MHHLELRLYPILGAMASRMVLGGLWYSPVLFLKRWMSLTGITSEKMNQGFGGKILVDLIGSFIMAGAMAHMIYWANATELDGGLIVSFLCWIGFTAVTTISTVTYEKRPFALWAIHNGYNLISMLIMGVILALWR